MPITPYPSGADYVEALQNPGVCFRDEKLKLSQVRLDKLGRPRPISGNFASVFALTAPTNGEKLAIKCFTRRTADQELRYRAVSDHLTTVEADWKVGFEYNPESILVRGQWYPILQMEWADGTNLISWIDKNIGNPYRIAHLAHNFFNPGFLVFNSANTASRLSRRCCQQPRSLPRTSLPLQNCLESPFRR